MIAIAHRLIPVALLAALMPGPAARAERYEVAGRAVEIPAPAGFDPVAAVQPFYAVAQATLPPDAQMLAAFVPHGYFDAHPADARPDSFLVATWRTTLSGRTVPPEMMAQAKDATAAELAPYLVGGGPAAPLGVYADFRVRTLENAGDRAVAWIGIGTVPPGGENGAGWREAYGGSVVHAQGTLVNLVIRAARLDDAGRGLEDAHRTLLDWTAAVVAANPAAPEPAARSVLAPSIAAAALAVVLILAVAAVRRRRKAQGRPG